MEDSSALVVVMGTNDDWDILQIAGHPIQSSSTAQGALISWTGARPFEG